MNNSPPDLSIVVPLHNEEKRIPGCMARWGNFQIANLVNLEVIFVPNGCSDNTERYAHHYSETRRYVRVLTIQERGKGAAVRAGMLAARGKLAYMADVDLSTPVFELKKFKEAIGQGFDVAIGSREMDRAHVTVPVKRRLFGRAFHLLTGLIVPGILDTQCGFKLFTQRAAREIFSQATCNGLAFDVEALYIARALGLTVAEIPVQWVHNEDSRVRLVGDSLEMLFDVLRVPLTHARIMKKAPA